MTIVTSRFRALTGVLLAVLLIIAAASVYAAVFPLTGPVFGLAIAPDSSVLVADASAGVFEIRKGQLSPRQRMQHADGNAVRSRSVCRC